MSPSSAKALGNTPTAMTTTTVMPRAALSEAGTRIGGAVPSGTGLIHISRATMT